MKTIIWVGNDMFIPNYGMAYKNAEKDLPEDMADEFIERGLAKLKQNEIVNTKEDK